MIKRTLWLTLLILCSLSCTRVPQKRAESGLVDAPEWFANDSLRAAYYYTEGVKYAALAEDTLQTIAYLQKVLEIDSLHAPTHYRLGMIYERDNLPKALQHTTLAYSLDSTNLDYQYQYGYQLALNGEYEKARECQTDLLTKDPKNYSAYYNAALLYAMTGMPHMAISILDSAEYKIGYDERLMTTKLDLLMRVGQTDRAIEELQRVCNNNPYDPYNWLELGRLLLEVGRVEEADECYKKATELAPNNEDVQLSFVIAYRKAGCTKQFLDTTKTLFLNDNAPLRAKIILWDEIVDDAELYGKNIYTANTLISILSVKYPNDLKVKELYATHLYVIGERERGMALFKELAGNTDNPNRKTALYTVVGIEKMLGRTDSIEVYLDKMIELYPTDVTPLMYKGAMEESKGNSKGALSYFERAVEVADDPKGKSLAYVTLADHLADYGKNIRKASKYYNKALKIDPNNSNALNNWAYFSSIAGGNLEEALERSTRACELEPTNPTFLDTKAWILYLLGRHKEALTVMKQAISLDSSGDQDLLLHYADILAANGEKFLAEVYYKRALDAGASEAIVEQRIDQLNQ